MQISLCMITRNEEKFLESCLNSAKGLVDEIVIVDTGSTDRTLEIAKKFTDKVFSVPWNDSFSGARNESLSHATKDWILVLDADETISKKDHALIKKLIKEKDVGAFILEQRNYTDAPSLFGWTSCTGEYGEEKGFAGYYPIQAIRLFRNNGKIKYKYSVHETVRDSVDKTGKAPVAIHHFGRSKGIKEKMLKYLELGKKDLAQYPNDPHVHYEIALIYNQLDDADNALNHLQEVLKINPGFRHALDLVGILAIRKGNLDAAFKAFKKSLELNPKNETALHYLAVILERAGKTEEAEKLFKNAIAINPNSAKSIINLARLYVNKNNFKSAFEVVDNALKGSRDNLMLISTKAEIYLAQKNYAKAIETLKNSLGDDNSSAMINLYWNLSAVYEESGDKKSAIETLKRALSLNPKNRELIEDRLAELESQN